MPPQKTQPAPVITDGDRLAVLEGLVRHVIDELHDQNKTLAKHTSILLNVDKLAMEAAPLLESPVAKFMAQRRALRGARADKQVVDG